jgi:transposase
LRNLLANLDSPIPGALHPALSEVADEISQLETRIGAIERQLEHLAKGNPIYKRLRSIPGVGLLTATAFVAFIGDVHRFPTSRHFASFLGLTPREYSSGNHRRLGHISKRGDVYLRMLLIHGARSVLFHANKSKSPDRFRVWACTLEKKRGHNIAAVALANKLARIIWAVW